MGGGRQVRSGGRVHGCRRAIYWEREGALQLGATGQESLELGEEIRGMLLPNLCLPPEVGSHEPVAIRPGDHLRALPLRLGGPGQGQGIRTGQHLDGADAGDAQGAIGEETFD